jgi:hypothetical protein
MTNGHNRIYSCRNKVHLPKAGGGAEEPNVAPPPPNPVVGAGVPKPPVLPKAGVGALDPKAPTK